jgi:hypothetical protein
MMPLGREIAGEVFQSFSEAETAALLRALMKIKENIRQVSENTKRFANGARHAG